MATLSKDQINLRIEEFKKRIEEDRPFCLDLFEDATIRLLAHKYAYYVHSCQFVDDYAYDHEETSWYIIGRALGALYEDDTSPCIDFDYNHPLANEAIILYNKLTPKVYLKE